MSSSDDNDLVAEGGARSPYDEPTETLDREAIERGTSGRRTPRRPAGDRDNFLDRHGRRPAPSPRAVDDTAPTTPLGDETAGSAAGDADGPSTADTAPVVTAADSGEAAAPTSRLPRSDVQVRSTDDDGYTEPFADPDDESDRPRGERRTAEHLTQDPLPYIEPQPTRPIDEEPVGLEPFDDEPAAPEPVVVAEPGETRVRRGTLDLGLLILRVVLGLTFTLHGLQKLTGWMNGPGPDGFAEFLKHTDDPSLGFDPNVAQILAIVGGVSETAGGILMILGLFTPIAGAALLGTVLIAGTFSATISGGLWYFAQDGNNSGIEYQIMLAAAAAALILTGPGTYSVDRRWGWARRPAWGSAVWLLIGIGSAIAVWAVFNGANPLVSR